MLEGTSPIVRVNDSDWEPELILTVLSPVNTVAGVQDQLPEASAVADIVCEFTVPVIADPAAVTPENVGVSEVTQN